MAAPQENMQRPGGPGEAPQPTISGPLTPQPATPSSAQYQGQIQSNLDQFNQGPQQTGVASQPIPPGQAQYPQGGSQTMPEQSAVMPDGTVAPLPPSAGQGPFQAPMVQERTVQAPTIDYSEYGPYTQSMTEDQLVSSQLQGLLASDSPYMRQAALAAERQAASRGLLSSSMAAGAGQAAAIQAAMPIAAADAQAYQRMASENAAAINSANLAKLQSVTNMATAQLSSMTNLATAAMGAEAQMKSAALSANAQTLVSQMQIKAQKDIETFRAEQEKILELQRQNGRVELSQMDYSQRDALMRSGFMHEMNMEQFRQQGQMNLAELNINAQKYLQERGFQQEFNMADLTHQQRLELTNMDINARERMMNMQFAHNFDMSQLNFGQQQSLQSIIHANSLEQMGFQGSVQASLFNQQAEAGLIQTIFGGVMNYASGAGAGGMDPNNVVASTANLFALAKSIFPDLFASGPDSP